MILSQIPIYGLKQHQHTNGNIYTASSRINGGSLGTTTGNMSSFSRNTQARHGTVGRKNRVFQYLACTGMKDSNNTKLSTDIHGFKFKHCRRN